MFCCETCHLCKFASISVQLYLYTAVRGSRSGNGKLRDDEPAVGRPQPMMSGLRLPRQDPESSGFNPSRMNVLAGARAMAAGNQHAPMPMPVVFNQNTSPVKYNARPAPARLAALPQLSSSSPPPPHHQQQQQQRRRQSQNSNYFQQQQQQQQQHKQASRADEPEARQRKAVAKELSKLQAALGGGPRDSAGLENCANTAQFLQLSAERLRGLRQQAAGQAAKPAPAAPPAEAVEGWQAEKQALEERLRKLEAENSKCKRYIQRQRANIEKLQSERKRYAEEKAQSDFKLVEALAGRGDEAAALLQGVKVEAGGDAADAAATTEGAESKLRERHEADAAAKKAEELELELQASKEKHAAEKQRLMEQQGIMMQQICELTAEVEKLKQNAES
eukprot:SAG22_NODE_204_length_15309_cov_12.747206_5_plen_391_part_00